MDDQTPYGVIFPVSYNHASRILHEGKTVFVKYPPHEVISERLSACRKLLLYGSGGKRRILGEADLQGIELLTEEEVLQEYSDELFLRKKELEEYARNRTKRMLVFILANPREYQQEVILDHYVTMVGEYITRLDYENMLAIPTTYSKP